MKARKTIKILFVSIFFFTLSQSKNNIITAANRTAGFLANGRQTLDDRDPILFTYVNDISNRRFLIYAEGNLYKKLPYNGSNQTESFGFVNLNTHVTCTYVNDISNRRFIVYMDGNLWRTIPYNGSNQMESFMSVQNGLAQNDTRFYSYVNDVSKREFRIYKNGTLFKIRPYNPANQVEFFGQYGYRYGGSPDNTPIYTYVNDASNRRFLIYADGQIWKTVPYNSSNQVESFGEISFSEKTFYSYVNDLSNRLVLLYKEGALLKTIPYMPSNQVESVGNIFKAM